MTSFVTLFNVTMHLVHGETMRAVSLT